MPSPVGHALAGFAAGALVAGSPPRGSFLASASRRALLFATLACLPDLDLLVGAHTMYTHSVGAVFLVTLLAWASGSRWSLVAACTLAYATHPFLDWLGRDASPPLGIMALWPFGSDYFMAPQPIITPVSRRYWLPGFWSHNLRVVSTEILVFGSIAAAAYWFRWRRRSVQAT